MTRIRKQVVKIWKCPVKSCLTRAKKGFYRIPEHPLRRSEWIKVLKLPIDVKKCTSVCWKHFKKEDFEDEMDPQFVNELGMGRLKQMVVPSLLLSRNPGDPGNLWSPGNPGNPGNPGDPGNPRDPGNPVESGMDLCDLTVRVESNECGKNVKNLENKGNCVHSIYHIVTSEYFNAFILFLIVINTISLALYWPRIDQK